MFKTKKPEAQTPREREFHYYYRAQFYVFRADHVSEARRQLRADLSAQAEREAVLTKVV